MWSCIIVAKGMWPVTERCLSTLLQTTDRRLELIYVDNGTPVSESPKSWEEMSRWSTERVLPIKMALFEDAVPLARAWNVCLRMSTGSKILICNNDLVFHKVGWLEEFEKALDDPAVGIVGVTGMSWQHTAFIQGSIFAIRREDVSPGGQFGFDERFLFTCEEVDFNLRLQRDGKRIQVLEHLKGEYIEHLEGATRNYYKADTTAYQRLAHISRLEFCYKHLGTLGDDSININD